MFKKIIVVVLLFFVFQLKVNAQFILMNPLQSNTLGLLKRVDVQNEIHIDLKQRQLIVELQTNSQKELQDKTRQQFDSLRNLPQNQRQQAFRELQSKMSELFNQSQNEINDRIKTILRPEQVKRLKELDLQARGILSLGDSKVAEELKIDVKKRVDITKIVETYRSTYMNFMTEEISKSMQSNGRGNFKMPDFNNPLSSQHKYISGLKNKAELEVAKLLSEEEKNSWKNAQGNKFTFRVDVQ